MRKGKLKDIAVTLLEQFDGRNNDFGGYWAMGKLYKQAKKEGHLRVSVNLLRGDVDFASEEFDRIAQAFRTRLKRHCRLRGTSYDSLASAIITVSFDDATEASTWRSGYGDPYVCDLSLKDINGRKIIARRTGYCRPHDPCRETKRWDKDLENLGMEGDGDDVDFVGDVEMVFSIKLTEQDTLACYTVGDLYELLLSKHQVASVEHCDNLCATHMAFNDVRRVLNGLSPVNVKPGMKLKDFGFRSHRSIYEGLSKQAGLNVPDFHHTKAALFAWLAGTVAPVSIIWVFDLAFVWAVLPMLWFTFALKFLPVRFNGTIGQLSKDIAYHNFGRYAARGSRTGTQSVWESLKAVCLENYGKTEKKITPTTFLMA